MYRVIDYPRWVAFEAYEQACDRMMARLHGRPGLRAIYQIGSVSTPGISDIDMVVVFADGASCCLEPLEGLTEPDQYLFTHSLYGAPLSHFHQAQRYSFFHNYRLLWGAEVDVKEQALGEEERLLKTQIALEYLLRLYATLVMQRVYGVFKLRSFFLHVKAVGYDLEFLDVEAGPLFDLTNQLVDWRARWFDRPPSLQCLEHTLEAFIETLEGFLKGSIARHGFYLPVRGSYRIARSIWLKPGRTLGYRHRGFVLPQALGRIGRKYFSIQNRLNRFVFTFPATQQSLPDILARRFALLEEMRQYNQQYLPQFDRLASGLGL